MIAPVDPIVDRLRDWVYGGEDFLKRVVSMVAGESCNRVDDTRRRLRDGNRS